MSQVSFLSNLDIWTDSVTEGDLYEFITKSGHFCEKFTRIIFKQLLQAVKVK